MSYAIEKREKKGTKYGCDLIPQQRGLINPKLYTEYELMRRRNVTGVILDPKGGDAGSVPGRGKKTPDYTERAR